MTTTMATTKDQIAAEHLTDLHTEFDAVHQVQTPTGMRLVFIARTGVCKGPKINGEVLPGSTDWVTLGTDGVAHMDVRALIRLDDGELATWTGQGVVDMSPEVRARFFSGEAIPSDEMYARSTLFFQTSSVKYSWLNGIVTVAYNSVGPTHVDYNVYQVL